MIYRVVRDEDVIFRTSSKSWRGERGIDLVLRRRRPRDRRGARRFSPDHLQELVPDIAERQVYVCGPPAMTEVIDRNVRRANVPPRLIHVEKFAL